MLADRSLPGFLRLLTDLRWLAVAGQPLAIVVAISGMDMPFAPPPLWAGVAVLILFNSWAQWRCNRGLARSPLELALHLAVDLGLLTWQLYWSAGTANPFVSLYLVPIALVAVALPLRWVLAVGLSACAAYLLLALFAPGWPHMHGARALQLDLHLWGMAINFLLSALLFAVALRYLGNMLGERERELSRLRERAARNEGILALGAHAAALAHALNTPLGSMQLILDDLELAPDDTAAQEDLRTLRQLAGECRARVQSLVAQAQSLEARPLPAGEFFGEVIERWRLLRPALRLQAIGLDSVSTPIRPEPLLEHLLLALLNNAGDASVEAGEDRIEVAVALQGNTLQVAVRDHGPGLESAAARRLQTLFETTKPQGLGLGLALSHATVDHFGGSLRLRAHPQGGSVAEVRLPLAALLSSPAAEPAATHG